MRIESANISMNAAHRYEQNQTAGFQKRAVMVNTAATGTGGKTAAFAGGNKAGAEAGQKSPAWEGRFADSLPVTEREGDPGSGLSEEAREEKLKAEAVKERILSGQAGFWPVDDILRQMENALGTWDRAVNTGNRGLTRTDTENTAWDLMSFGVFDQTGSTETVSGTGQSSRRYVCKVEDPCDRISSLQELRQLIIRRIMERIFGKHGLKRADDTEERLNRLLGQETSAGTAWGSTFDSWSDVPLYGGEYAWYGAGSMQLSVYKLEESEAYSLYEEAEDTSVEMQGTVRTSDGRDLDLSLTLRMSRSFTDYYEERFSSLSKVPLCDPLVINFDTPAASLSPMTFRFDLDADGEEDEIHTLGAGSGYLALDLNENGQIDDGTELFGTRSGSGFADLSAYDEDGNGWIDENDPIWQKLKIWTMGEDGTAELYTLADKGIGALYLSSAASDFALKGEENDLRGRIRETGMFLFENGTAGTMQHVDLAKAPAGKGHPAVRPAAEAAVVL